MQIAGYLWKQGFESQIYDLSNHDPQNGLLEAAFSDADVVGIAMHTDCTLGADLLCRKIPAINPAAKIIIGGHHATHCWRQVLEDCPNVYAVVVGEGEVPMANLVTGISDRSYNRNHIGVAYRDASGKFVHNRRAVNRDLRDVELDLSQLRKECFCFPLVQYARRLFPQRPRLLKEYLQRNRYHKGCMCAGVLTTRGCPTKCAFCTFEMAKGFYKHRIDYVLSILEWCYSKGIRNLIFYESTFLADPEHVEDLCHAMINHGLNFRWTTQTQVHHEDLAIIDLMAEAGLVQMNIGLESGSPKIIKDMNKKFMIEEFPRVVEAYHRAGVGVSANMIIGSPNESDVTVKESCGVFYQVDPDVVGETQDLRLYPGSVWYKEAVREGRLSSEWDWNRKGIPRFIFHDQRQVKHWQIVMAAHLRYAKAFHKVRKPVKSIQLVNFPSELDHSVLLDAIHFAFPDMPIFHYEISDGNGLILYFSETMPVLAGRTFFNNSQFIWCRLNGRAFELLKIDLGSQRKDHGTNVLDYLPESKVLV